VRAVRRRLPIVLLCALLVPAAALAYSLTQQKQYTACAALLFRDPQLDQKLFGSTVFQPSTDPTREAATNVKLVSLETVAARTSRALNGRLTPSEVQSQVAAASEGESDVASICATDPSPKFAPVLANTFAQQFVAFRRDADRSKIATAQKLVQAQLAHLTSAQIASPQARTLRTQNEQLSILAALQTGNAELVQPANPPSSPSSPQTTRNVILGFVFGLLLGLGLAVLLERLDRRLRSVSELGEAFGRPVLGAVPESRVIAKSDGMRRLEPAEAEAFRMLRANLRYFNVDREIKSVLITSATPGEGKSTVAMYLALAAASSGARVLLVEADLRRPTLNNRLGISTSHGISEVLAGARDLRSAIDHIELESSQAAHTLDVLTAGPIPPNPSDLVESDKMRKIIEAAEDAYDLVIIDTPPTSVVSDAIPLVRLVSGVLVVTRLGKTTKDSAHHLHDQLQNLDANVLGVVVNSASRRAGYGPQQGYGYSYGYEPVTERGGSRERSETVARPVEDGSSSMAAELASAADVEPSSRGASPPTNGNGHSPSRSRVP
jgi:receptor protein-tyrosine kinase